MSEYSELGQVIRSHRLAADKSIEDLSGAIEVEPKFITDLEKGETKPPQDILLLIINHLDIEETDANKLWQLAGYNNQIADDQNDYKPETTKDTTLTISLPDSLPVLYTDMVNVVSNKYGVVFNFVQGVGPKGQPTVVSRVGMSHEHAKSILEVLQKTLDQPKN